ncbi:MAG: family 20 glycosylhydrolase [Rudaea sp.]|nr:family 20 glycosylhydrolase [Rudaea sp.]
MRIAMLVLVLILVACQSAPQQHKPPPPSLIPLPASVDLSPGYFTLHQGAALNIRSGNPAALGVARYFADLLARTRDIHLDVRPFDAAENDDGIIFVLDPQFLVRDDSSDEGYELTVASHGIRLIARTPHGLFNGSVTLWQWLTQDTAHKVSFDVPCVHIEDHPRFAWRGLMLDSARRYQSPEFIKQLLDEMARHKLDVFHWHLTDDQGWRIEIKQYPKLTDIGAWRIPASVYGAPSRYGGFYTQEQIRDIVRFAAERYITIVPEIEMPGHAQAAIAAYPELGVTGVRPPVSPDWGVHTYLYNVDDSTFSFLENVLTEVMDLFPGNYVHIGGDEAAKDQWQASAHIQQRMRELGVADETALQSWFIARIERFLDDHGRKLIGWDEILQGGLPPRATVMSWQGTKGGIEAARQGHDVVMAPSPLMYFDHVQSQRHDEPPGRPDVVSLDDVYAYEPTPQELDSTQARHVLGAQANLWSEYMDTTQRVEHAAFPRADALAEVLWSPPSRRNWAGFLSRLPAQLDRYRALGIDFADSAFAADITAKAGRQARGAEVEISNQTHFGDIHYSLDRTPPSAASAAYRAPVSLALPAWISAVAFAQGRALAAPEARVLDAGSLARLNSDALLPCKPGLGLPLRLPGPVRGGGEAVYRVDIFDPCWIYPHADLDNMRRLEVIAAALPYNFQLWKDADKVVLRPGAAPAGELQVRKDTCDGDVLDTIALPAATTRQDTAQLQATLPHGGGVHDLCLFFTRARIDPMWAIDTVQLLP